MWGVMDGLRLETGHPTDRRRGRFGKSLGESPGMRPSGLSKLKSLWPITIWEMVRHRHHAAISDSAATVFEDRVLLQALVNRERNRQFDSVSRA